MKCFFWTASALPAWQSTFKIRGMMAIEDIRNPTSGGCLRGVQDQLEDMMVGMHCKEFQHLALVVLTPFLLVPYIYIYIYINVKPCKQSGCTQFFGWWTAHLPWLMQSEKLNIQLKISTEPIISSFKLKKYQWHQHHVLLRTKDPPPLWVSPTSPHPMSPVCSWRSLPMVSWPQAVDAVVGKLPAPPSCERILRGAVLDQAPVVKWAICDSLGTPLISTTCCACKVAILIQK